MKMAFVCKQRAVLVVRINNIGQEQCRFNGLIGIFFHLILYHIPQLA